MIQENIKKKWYENFPIPHTYVIVFSLIIMAGIATYLIPGGKYQKKNITYKINGVVKSRNVIDPVSYKKVSSVPQNPWLTIKSIMEGMKHHDTVGIIFFILIIGGAFGIVTKTRAVEAALAGLVTKLGNKEKLIIPSVMIAFSIGGATFGMCEETIPFIAMVVPMAMKLGYDSITGVAMVYIGAMIGFATAFLNPFTVGIAQGIAQIKIFSGFGYRFGLWIFFTGFTIFWVMRYAAKVKANPESSLMYELDKKKKESNKHSDTPEFNIGRKLVLIMIAIAFLLIIYGAIKLDWYIDEMVAIFFSLGIISGLINRLPLNTMAESFAKGCSDIANAAIIIGFAKTVLVLLENGKVMDTILHSVSTVVGKLPAILSIQCMYIFQTLTNFFVPSGSGQAALTMPIMAPLADMVNITRQTAVLAYQFGDGFSNMIIPTSAVTIAAIGMAGIPWGKWAKWIFPLMVIYFILGALLLIPPTLLMWNG
ncbi:YfcC family protein [bacterium]|nr:YfcC family protein [bacterium]